MPTLKWIGKDKVINYYNEVPFRLLNEKKKFSVNGNNTENLLIKGDNLEALKALLPYYYNKIKVVYIDPPYNTGNEKWIYNDNVNSPEIKRWLGKIVGSEEEDLNHHDKWLCMMLPRLKLLKELLREDGVIFVSIDDNEVDYLRRLMDDVFRGNFISQLVWKGKSGAEDDKYFRTVHEYVLCYGKNRALFKVAQQIKLNDKYPKYDSIKKRHYKTQLARKWGSNSRRQDRPNLYYPIKAPDGTDVFPKLPDGKDGCWRWSNDRMLKELKLGNIEFKNKNGSWVVYQKIYEPTEEEGPRTKKYVSLLDDVGSTTNGTEEIKRIFGRAVFDHPKPTSLVARLLKMAGANKDSVILDSFAGSGTTAHAVLDLNKEDGGNRKFILVELENDIAETITAQRLKRVIEGYSYRKSNGEIVKIEGLGGGFKFLELGNPLFDGHKQVIGEPSYEDLAGYVYFTETHDTVNWEKANGNDWYIGEYGGVHYFIIYEGKGKGELGEEFLKVAKRYNGEKIVYADTLMVDDDFLEKYNIVFKQIPYEIKTF